MYWRRFTFTAAATDSKFCSATFSSAGEQVQNTEIFCEILVQNLTINCRICSASGRLHPWLKLDLRTRTKSDRYSKSKRLILFSYRQDDYFLFLCLKETLSSVLYNNSKKMADVGVKTNQCKMWGALRNWSFAVFVCGRDSTEYWRKGFKTKKNGWTCSVLKVCKLV